MATCHHQGVEKPIYLNYNKTWPKNYRPIHCISQGKGKAVKVKLKAKQSRYRPAVAQRVSGS